ncbi:MAG: hypothetical protein B7X90_08300 [Novosphingobium sp. 17-62-19]|uniref:hypothetical protein n=1 Tax=Novosphingobium sp. 17-62-19 TaxID=1970406 RepID=UPI000BD5BBC5|nr:hypothetical protein [Novosphingobium sp. 17-62-19]OZA19661.1 MAG: hypothetical protein B7X90_08300 [Novosphingobium sp. 17-62-19]HQS97933.1 hypothetical protein [Novosphingobium sp.]
MTIGWKITRECRADLLRHTPPTYQRVIADHVTLSIVGSEPPAPVSTAMIVGRADDGAGVEAMVVALNGSTARPDGKVWHITWSLADDRTARESNDVIAAQGWTATEQRFLVLEPAVW